MAGLIRLHPTARSITGPRREWARVSAFLPARLAFQAVWPRPADTPWSPTPASYSRLRILPSRSDLGRPLCISSRGERGLMAGTRGPHWPDSLHWRPGLTATAGRAQEVAPRELFGGDDRKEAAQRTSCPPYGLQLPAPPVASRLRPGCQD